MNTTSVGKEILNQLGGNRFISMTGANTFVTDGDNLCLKFKGSNKANYLRVTLNAMDTYTMEFAKITSKNVYWHSMQTNVYNDMLESIFTKVTGLQTRL